MTSSAMLFFLLASSMVQYVFSAKSSSIYDNQANDKWFKDAVDLTKKNFQMKPNTRTAKNVIFFLGDGMGISTTTAGRIFEGQTRNEKGEENVLSWETFPYTAISKTYNTDAQVPDSAGTATAFACGVKTGVGILGLNEKAIYGDCASVKGNEVLSILTYAELAGLSTGIVTNTKVTHATPAAYFSHTASRKWENDQRVRGDCVDIARQLIEYPYGDGIEVVLGGGRQAFLPCGSHTNEGTHLLGSKCRRDAKNLTNDWLKKYNNSRYVWDREGLKNVDAAKTDHLLGLFSDDGMAFFSQQKELKREHEPTLTEMTEKAIEILSKNPKGYFLMVEGGLIDWGHHSGKAKVALTETVELHKAVKRAKELVNEEETLMILTADHSHTMVLYGYAPRGNPILGFQTKNGDDGKPMLSLSYANGPGATLNGSRANLTGVDYNNIHFLQQAGIKTPSESHAAEDVGIYATGPFAHLLHGVVEQNYIFHVMDYALCLTESKQGSCSKHSSRGGSKQGSCSKHSSCGGHTNSAKSVTGFSNAIIAILILYLF